MYSAILKVLKNKYSISLIAFTTWILFFDRNDLFTQLSRKKELQKLEDKTFYYETEITNTKKDLTDLSSKPAILEKYAREKFYLKHQNEDIFLITDSSKNKK